MLNKIYSDNKLLYSRAITLDNFSIARFMHTCKVELFRNTLSFVSEFISIGLQRDPKTLL